MYLAYDEVMAASFKRHLEPPRIVGYPMKVEIAEKQARSIRYQFKIAKLPLGRRMSMTSTLTARPSTRPWSGI